ncbi:MAG: Flp family type IVb pilin [Bdellovibrionales bacterium]|nr:Flp family type IVb pilin [Bdellovibrionales bacterium]
MKQRLTPRAVWKRESGATLFEYAILASLIAVLSIAAVRYFGNSVNDTFVDAKTAIESL